jgi:hypothetical protein
LPLVNQNSVADNQLVKKLACLVIVAFLASGACGGSSDKTSTAQVPKNKPDPNYKPIASNGKKWKRWRWKGERDECYFTHKNRCYSKLAPACKAAGCDESECSANGAAPASVSCPTKN